MSSPPPSLLSRYRNLVLTHASLVASIESTLMNSTYLLLSPGRFKHAEVAAEAVYSATHLLGYLNDHVVMVMHNNNNNNTGNHIFSSSSITSRKTQLINKYTRAIMTTATATSNNNNNTSTTNLAYTVAAYGLALVKSCQVLAEMLSNIVDGSRSDGYEWGRYRWSTVIGIELIKTALKSSLLILSSSRKLLLASPIPTRDYDLAQLAEGDGDQIYNINLKNRRCFWVGERTGKRYQTVESLLLQPSSSPSSSSSGVGVGGGGGGYESHLVAASQRFTNPYDIELLKRLKKTCNKNNNVTSAVDLLRSLKGVELAGEWVYVTRPLIYVLALRQFGRKSWIPWVLSLVLEVSSLATSFHKQQDHQQQPTSATTATTTTAASIMNSLLRLMPRTVRLKGELTLLERQEVVRRAWLLLYYLVRSPAYQGLGVKKILDDIFQWRLFQWRLFSVFTGILVDYQAIWEQYYFYTSK